MKGDECAVHESVRVERVALCSDDGSHKQPQQQKYVRRVWLLYLPLTGGAVLRMNILRKAGNSVGVTGGWGLNIARGLDLSMLNLSGTVSKREAAACTHANRYDQTSGMEVSRNTTSIAVNVHTCSTSVSSPSSLFSSFALAKLLLPSFQCVALIRFVCIKKKKVEACNGAAKLGATYSYANTQSGGGYCDFSYTAAEAAAAFVCIRASASTCYGCSCCLRRRCYGCCYTEGDVDGLPTLAGTSTSASPSFF
jgi:hypothetical protein